MADVSVRPARVEDVPDIARIQVETWRAAYADLLPAEVLARATEERARTEWHAAVATPPSPLHRVLVAMEQQWLVGFAAFGPGDPAGGVAGEPGDDAAADGAGGDGAAADDAVGDGAATDGAAGDGGAAEEIYALLVEPRWGRRGHGSRLLAATVDHLRADGAARALVWVVDGDVASRRFYASAGWEPDGYVRTLEDGGRTVRESRLHVSLAEGEGDQR